MKFLITKIGSESNLSGIMFWSKMVFAKNFKKFINYASFMSYYPQLNLIVNARDTILNIQQCIIITKTVKFQPDWFEISREKVKKVKNFYKLCMN